MHSPPSRYSTQTRNAGARHLRNLLPIHGPDRLEEGLIRRYLITRLDRTVLSNREMIRIVADRSPAATVVDAQLDGFDTPTIESLIRWFEALVPVPDGTAGTRNPDAVFTPEWVANMMAQEAITPERRDSRVVDPACGCGALLIAAFRRIWALHPDSQSPTLAKHIIDQQLCGVDLDPCGVRRTKLLLTLAVIEVGADNESYTFSNIEHRDSLNVAAWGAERFDVVLGNPPYIRFHELTEQQRADYRTRFQVLSNGNFNLYYAFFELAHRLCADGGVVAYITPNTYFHAASAKPLRQWMQTELVPTKIVNFGAAQIFSAVATYTALTFADRTGPANPHLRYAVGSDPHHNPIKTMPPSSKFSTINRAELDTNGAIWRLADQKARHFMQRVQSNGPPLLEIADIRFGAATLRDHLYLLGGDIDDNGRYLKHYGGETFRIEPAATVPAVKVPNVTTAAELRTHPVRIIFPYTHNTAGTAVIWEPSELAQFPETKRYLETIRAELAARDNGKKTYAAWFAYGRTQGLAAWRGERLLTPLYAATPRFIRDTSPEHAATRIFFNGCSVTPKAASGVPIGLLEALLNSTTLQHFIEQISAPLAGGFYSYQKRALTEFHIHDDAVTKTADILAVSGEERDALIADIYQVPLP